MFNELLEKSAWLKELHEEGPLEKTAKALNINIDKEVQEKKCCFLQLKKVPVKIKKGSRRKQYC